MKKLWSTLFAISTLGCLLTLGAAPASAYYSPLPATATVAGNSVTRSVYDPKLGKPVDNNTNYQGVVDLKQDHGVIAWVYQIGQDYYVTCCVYDPGAATFKEDTQGPYQKIYQLQVKDGVVAYVATISGGGDQFGYATYDPAKGAWQNRSYLPSESNVSNLTVETQDGVVVFSYYSKSSGNTYSYLRADIYDSAVGNWYSAVSVGVPEVIFTDNVLAQTCKYDITNSTINNTITTSSGTKYPKTWGYDPSKNVWYNGPTIPLARFVAQPYTSDAPSLWVWFTDMSIAATKWDWDFGDNSTSPDRSPHHTYTSAGVFLAKQSINNGASTYTKAISTIGVIQAWNLAYSAMVNPNDLDLLRQYRDEVMSHNASGKRYRTMLYDNSEAALRALLQNPEMLVTLRKLFLANKGAVRQVLQGQVGVINDPEAVNAFLKTLGEKSPPGLRALSDTIRKEMRQKQNQGQPFLGFRLRRLH